MPLIRYRLEREAKGINSLPNEPHNFLDGLSLSQVEKRLTAPTIDGKALTEFVDDREKVLNALLSAGEPFGKPADILTGEPSQQRAARMLIRFDKAVAAAAGVSARLSSTNQILIPGQNASFDLELTNKGKEAVRINAVPAALDPKTELKPIIQPKEATLNAGAT